MTVRSLQSVLLERTQEYLEERAPDDVDFFFDLSLVSVAGEVENGPAVIPAWHLGIYAQVDKACPKHDAAISAVVPYHFFRDGDMECLENVLGPLWTDLSFMLLVAPSEDGMNVVQGEFVEGDPDE